MNILAMLIGALIGDILPAVLIIGFIRLLLKKKLSKGWCIFVFVISTFCSFSIGMFFIGKPVQLGTIDYLIHFILITTFLYDKNAPSYFDTKKEIRRKRELKIKVKNKEKVEIDKK
ncbi:hypothetical protein HDR58_01080 [bacterium]|nr:hypothetical protein [bacterium]